MKNYVKKLILEDGKEIEVNGGVFVTITPINDDDFQSEVTIQNIDTLTLKVIIANIINGTFKQKEDKTLDHIRVISKAKRIESFNNYEKEMRKEFGDNIIDEITKSADEILRKYFESKK